MSVFEITLFITTVLCSLVAGFLVAFSTVVMPGIKNLKNKQFLIAFREMDLVIQERQPLFMFIWVGSVFSTLALLLQSFFIASDSIHWYTAIISLIFLLGVQLPTIVINIPLNNHIQKLNIESMSDDSLQTERLNFENKWNRSNVVRSIFSVVTSILLILLLIID